MALEISPESFGMLADRACRAASEYLAGLDGGILSGGVRQCDGGGD
jgi:hypothetical protein